MSWKETAVRANAWFLPYTCESVYLSLSTRMGTTCEALSDGLLRHDGEVRVLAHAGG